MLLPLTQIVGMLVKVLFPALALIQEDIPKVKSLYLRSIAIIALVTFPFSVGLWLVAEDFILTLLGQKWSEAIGVFKILAWAGLIQCVISPIGSLLSALGKTRFHFVLGVISSVIGISFICLGLYWRGVYGVAYGVVFWAFSGVLINMYATHKVIGLNPWEFIKSLLPIVLVTAVMGASGYFCSEFLLQNFKGVLRLIIVSFYCVLIYTSLLYLFRVSAFQEVLKIVLPKLSKKRNK